MVKLNDNKIKNIFKLPSSYNYLYKYLIIILYIVYRKSISFLFAVTRISSFCLLPGKVILDTSGLKVSIILSDSFLLLSA